MGEHDKISRVWDILEEAQDCMLVTRDGSLMRARPMAHYARKDDNLICFLTDARNHKDDEIDQSPDVCLTLESGNVYLSVSGVATISKDKEKIAELWDTIAEAWFDGKDDPNVRLLELRPAAAEYWDRPSSIVAPLKTAAAAVTGKRPDMGVNEKVLM